MKGDQMGILAAYPTQRELPLSNQTRFSSRDGFLQRFDAARRESAASPSNKVAARDYA